LGIPGEGDGDSTHKQKTKPPHERGYDLREYNPRKEREKENKKREGLGRSSLLGAGAGKIKPTNSRNDKVNDHQGNKAENDPELTVLPPHGALQTGGALPELMRRAVEVVCLVDKQLNLLLALKNFVNIGFHHPSYLVNLRLHFAELIGVYILRKEFHLLAEFAAEVFHCISKCSPCLITISSKESLTDVLKELESDGALKSHVAHAHVNKTVIDNVMERKFVVNIAHFVILRRNLRENASCNGREVASGGSVFRENIRTTSNKRVNDRHV